MFETGWLLSTSFYGASQSKSPYRTFQQAHPAGVWVKESPVNTVVQDILHFPTAIEEHCQHALPQFYDASIFFCLGRLRGIVCHGVLLGYGWYDKGGVEVDQSRAQRGKFRVSALHFETLLLRQIESHESGTSVYTPQLMVYWI